MSQPTPSTPGTSPEDDAYRIETHPAAGDAPVTVPPGWHFNRIHWTDDNSVWLIYNPRTHTPITMPAYGDHSYLDTVLDCRGWKQVAVTANELVFFGPNSPATQRALDVLFEGTVSYDCAIRIVEDRARAAGRRCALHRRAR